MHFVDTNLLTKLIELAEKSREQANDFLRLGVLREFCEANHVCVQKGHILKAIDHSLIIFDPSKNVQGHQFTQQVLRVLDLNFDNPFLVILPPDFHLAAVRRKNQERKEHELKHAIDDVRLEIEHLKLNEEEVLRDQSAVQNDLN